MGIESPEDMAAGAAFFPVRAGRRDLSPVDPSVGCWGVQNTLVINALLRWGKPRQNQQRFLPELASKHRRRVRPFRSGLGKRRLRVDDARATTAAFRLTGRKLWITNVNEAVLLWCLPRSSVGKIPAASRHSHPAQGRRILVARRKTSWVSRQQHLRADPRRLPGGARERAGRGRQRL